MVARSYIPKAHRAHAEDRAHRAGDPGLGGLPVLAPMSQAFRGDRMDRPQPLMPAPVSVPTSLHQEGMRSALHRIELLHFHQGVADADPLALRNAETIPPPISS